MPAHGNFVLDKGYDAAAAITKLRAVKFSAEETVTPVTASTDIPCGVSQFDVTTAELAKNKGASVRVLGVTEMESAAIIPINSIVCITANGRATTLALAAAGDRVIGRCTKGAAVSGDRCSVALDGTFNVVK